MRYLLPGAVCRVPLDSHTKMHRPVICRRGREGGLEQFLQRAFRVRIALVADSEVWPDAVTLIYEDEVGQRHTLCRSKLKDVTNADPDGPIYIPIESYAQGETAQTIQHCDKDPTVLLSFTDTFIDLKELKNKDDELRDSLLENQTEIQRLQLDVKRIPEIEAAKKVADQQLATLKTQKAGDVVALEQKLATERQFRDGLVTKLNTLLKAVNSTLTSEDLKSITAGMDGSTLAVGKAEFEAVQKLVNDLATSIDTLSTDLKTQIGDTVTKINEQLRAWTAKEQETQNKIEELRRDLERQKIKLDIAFIRKVTKDATDFETKLVELKKSVPKVRDAFKRRRELFHSRRELRSRIFTTRQAFATVMNKNLASAVVDYGVSLRFHEGTLSKEFEEIIKTQMGWRTSQVPKAQLIASRIAPVALLNAIDKKDTTVLEDITDENGVRVFSKTEAQEVIAKLKEWSAFVAIERCMFEDRPEIKVSRTIHSTDGTKTYQTKDLSKLSLGQQHLYEPDLAVIMGQEVFVHADRKFGDKRIVRRFTDVWQRIGGGGVQIARQATLTPTP